MHIEKPYGVDMVRTVKQDLYIDPLARGAIHHQGLVPMLNKNAAVRCPFSKVTSYHGRSMQDPLGFIIDQSPLTDENNDVYTAFSIKGADASQPDAHYYAVEPNDVRVIGMMDANTFDRCQFISRLLRRNGVLTEWPIYHGRPKSFPVASGSTNLNGFRSDLLRNYLTRQRQLRDLRDLGVSTAEQPNDVEQTMTTIDGLSIMRFAVMYRAMLSNARVGELEYLKQSGDGPDYVTDAIEALIKRNPEHFAAWRKFSSLPINPESPVGHKYFLTRTLPGLMGASLARLHEIGGLHRYAHAGNWTLAGELVDLDSVRHPDFESDDAAHISPLGRLHELFTSRNDAVGTINDYIGKPSSLAEQSFNHAYFEERSYGPQTEFESIVLESHLLQPEDAVLGNLGPPQIITLTAAGLADAMIYAFEQTKKATAGPPDAAEFRKHLKIGTYPAAAKQVLNYLESQGVDLANKQVWLNPARILHLEIMKMQSQPGGLPQTRAS
jgi:hypothetical protein